MDLKKRCLCCGYKSLDIDSIYDVCPVCFWKDDPIQNKNPDYDGGANELCLIDAKKILRNVVQLMVVS